MSLLGYSREADGAFKIKNVLAYDYHPKSDRIVLAFADQTVSTYNLSNRQKNSSFSLNFQVSEVKIAPNGFKFLFLDK